MHDEYIYVYIFATITLRVHTLIRNKLIDT